MQDRKFKFFAVRQTEDVYAGKLLYTVFSNKSGAELAVIFWYPQWKQWVFRADDDSVWSADCLHDVIEVLNELNGGNNGGACIRFIGLRNYNGKGASDERS